MDRKSIRASVALIFLLMLINAVISLSIAFAFDAGPSNLEPAVRGAAQEDLQRFARSLVVQQGVRHKNLVVFPVTLRETFDATAYMSLDEALESGKVKITEIDSGSVPTLRLTVSASDPMFFMAGEVVTGAKQDRILRQDLLFKGASGVYDIPVYCVEQGRWTSVGSGFSSGKTLGGSKVRQSAALDKGQGKVWAEVSEQNARMDADAPTDTMQASYNSERFKKEGQGYLDALLSNPGLSAETVGVVVAIDGKVVSADVFANPTVFRKLWSKVLKAAVVDALSAGDRAIEDNTAAREFLGAAVTASATGRDNPSQGWEYTLDAGKVEGTMLIHKSGVVHLALFNEKIEPENERFQQRENVQQMQQQRSPRR